MADETEIPDYFDTEIESPMAEPPADPRDEEIMALKEEVAALKDRMLRFAAEMDNTRKRLERERAEAALYAATNFAKDMLSVTDNLGRALAAVSEKERAAADLVTKNLLAGVEVVEREVLNSFQRHGIRKLDTVGEKFDPNMHQALFEVPTSEHPPRHRRTGSPIGLRHRRPLPETRHGRRRQGRGLRRAPHNCHPRTCCGDPCCVNFRRSNQLANGSPQ